MYEIIFLERNCSSLLHELSSYFSNEHHPVYIQIYQQRNRTRQTGWRNMTNSSREKGEREKILDGWELRGSSRWDQEQTSSPLGESGKIASVLTRSWLVFKKPSHLWCRGVGRRRLSVWSSQTEMKLISISTIRTSAEHCRSTPTTSSLSYKGKSTTWVRYQ